LRPPALAPQLKRDPLGSGAIPREKLAIGAAMSNDRRVTPFVIGGMVAAVAWNSIGLVIARQFELSLIYLIPATVTLYAAFAGVVAWHSTWHVGVFTAAAMAAVDMSVGTAVSWITGASVPPETVTLEYFKNVAWGAVMLAGLGGFIGAPIGAYMRSRKLGS